MIRSRPPGEWIFPLLYSPLNTSVVWIITTFYPTLLACKWSEYFFTVGYNKYLRENLTISASSSYLALQFRMTKVQSIYSTHKIVRVRNMSILEMNSYENCLLHTIMNLLLWKSQDSIETRGEVDHDMMISVFNNTGSLGLL